MSGNWNRLELLGTKKKIFDRLYHITVRLYLGSGTARTTFSGGADPSDYHTADKDNRIFQHFLLPEGVAEHRHMYEETYEYIRRRYPDNVVDDPDGPRTTEATQARLEKGRAQQKEALALCRARVADLERELHFARKELEDTYDLCRPKEGEFYRLSREPDTIVRVFKVLKDTNKVLVFKYDEETGRATRRGLYAECPDEAIGYLVRRNTAVQEQLEASSEEDKEDCEPPKKKRVMAAICSTGVPPRRTDVGRPKPESYNGNNSA
eukprot:scaffold4863_cov138-Cylindrotheca_fusiformis.AAC.1